MDSSIRRGTIEMIVAMMISGTIGLFVLRAEQPVKDVVFWRCLLGAMTLAGICARYGLLQRRLLSARQFAWAMASGLAIVGNWLLLFAAYRHASIGIATAVYNTQPFMLVALGTILLGERPGWNKVGWLVISFLGVLAITQVQSVPSYGEGGHYLLGVGLSLGAAFLYAVAAIIVKRLAGIPPHLIAMIQVCVGSLILAPLAELRLDAVSLSNWGALITLGVVHTGVMYVLLYGAIQKLPTPLIGALSFIYPLVAIIVDWVVFAYRLSFMQWLGAAIILLAAAAIQQGWRLLPR